MLVRFSATEEVHMVDPFIVGCCTVEEAGFSGGEGVKEYPPLSSSLLVP
jgi:hypothetical protein